MARKISSSFGFWLRKIWLAR